MYGIIAESVEDLVKAGIGFEPSSTVSETSAAAARRLFLELLPFASASVALRLEFVLRLGGERAVGAPSLRLISVAHSGVRLK